MIERLDALIFWSADCARTVAFYRAIGLPLETEDHGDGDLHFACDIGGVHVAVLPARRTEGARTRGEHGASQPSFRVASLDRAIDAIRGLGELRLIIDRQEGPWGVRVVVEDPDGRALQLTTAG
jgi:catechol 2,3-dioxygenase-like lactoylglutathione lyase family enzyme